MDNEFGELFVVCVLTIFLLVGLGIFGYFSGKATCLASYADLEARHALFSGCQIRVNDKWIPASSYYVKEDK